METLKTSRLILLAITLILPATGALARSPHFEHHDESADHEEGAHYSDKGAKPTKAARLGVVMQSRAFIDKAGTTEFELTTGKLDDTKTPPGNIDSVEVELRLPPSAKDHDGEHEGREKEGFEKEYRHLKGGGYFHAFYTKLARGQTLAVKARVSGFEIAKANRHDDDESEHGRIKVELADVVQSRPDIAVQKLDYAASARPNTAVLISALVAERMRDVGAHTDCALFVDGTQVDMVPGMWVDAGSPVTCRLTYTFKVVGKHTVKVVAQNVHPGDYDLSNNSMEGSILIQSPTTLFYSADTFDSTSTDLYATDDYYSAASTVPDHHLDTKSVSWVQGRYFSGHLPVAIGLPLKKLSYTDSSDGVALSTFSFTDVSADATMPSGDPAYTTESVIQRFDYASGGWLALHRYENTTTGAGCTTIDVHWDGGVATYASTEYCRAASGFTCAGGDYTMNSAWGAQVKLGAGYAADVVMDDGTAYAAHPSMALSPSPSSQSYSSPASCMPANFGGPTLGKTCTTYSGSVVAKEGTAALPQ
jgi:hypothetical protein